MPARNAFLRRVSHDAVRSCLARVDHYVGVEPQLDAARVLFVGLASLCELVQQTLKLSFLSPLLAHG
jgi:hypothetical protein